MHLAESCQSLENFEKMVGESESREPKAPVLLTRSVPESEKKTTQGGSEREREERRYQEGR